MLNALLDLLKASFNKYASISNITGHLHVIIQTIEQECAQDANLKNAAIDTVITLLQNEKVQPVAPVVTNDSNTQV